jgi:hypothetical protein
MSSPVADAMRPMATAPDTVTVSATVLQIKRADAGRLLALAEVEIEIAGVAFTLHGVRVIKTGPRSRGVAAPCVRVAGGRLAEAISLPPELTAAIASAVLDEYDATLRAPPLLADAAGIGGGARGERPGTRGTKRSPAAFLSDFRACPMKPVAHARRLRAGSSLGVETRTKD